MYGEIELALRSLNIFMDKNSIFKVTIKIVKDITKEILRKSFFKQGIILWDWGRGAMNQKVLLICTQKTG